MQDVAYNLDAFGILNRTMKWFCILSLGCLLVAGCADIQKDQSVIEDVRGRPYTIPIEPTLVGDEMSYQLVYYSAPQIDLGKVPIKEIEIAVLDPKEVMARSNSGRSALASATELARQRQGMLKAQEEKLKILQEEIKGTADGATRKVKLEKEFVTEFEKYQQNGKKFQEELVGEQRRLLHLYTSRIRSAVEVVAKREGLDLVLDGFIEELQAAKDLLSPAVSELLKGDFRDITSETVQEMDKLY